MSTSSQPPIRWSASRRENVAWKMRIPGLGHSSPVVWGDRVFVTTAVPKEDRTLELKTGDVDKAGIDPAGDLVPHSWRLYSLDRSTGRILWERTAHEGVPRVKRHVKSSHASATPAANGTHVVALFGSEGLFCYDMEGKLLWKRDLGVLDLGLVEDPSYQWGPGSSPILYEGLVIVQSDCQKNSSLTAFDLRTGDEVWRAPREELPSWSTPVIHKTATGAVLVTSSPRFIRGYDPQTGRELFRFADNQAAAKPGDHQGEVKVASPVTAGDLVIATGGYPSGGRPIYALRAGALAWKTERGSPYTPTPLVYEGLLYVVTDSGILSAYEVTTGKRIYQQLVAPGASGFSASPVAAAGRIYLTSEDGNVYVVRAGPTFELIATNEMDEVCMATPALSGGFLILRTLGHVYGIRQ